MSQSGGGGGARRNDGGRMVGCTVMGGSNNSSDESRNTGAGRFCGSPFCITCGASTLIANNLSDPARCLQPIPDVWGLRNRRIPARFCLVENGSFRNPSNLTALSKLPAWEEGSSSVRMASEMDTNDSTDFDDINSQESISEAVERELERQKQQTQKTPSTTSLPSSEDVLEPLLRPLPQDFPRWVALNVCEWRGQSIPLKKILLQWPDFQHQTVQNTAPANLGFSSALEMPNWHMFSAAATFTNNANKAGHHQSGKEQGIMDLPEITLRELINETMKEEDFLDAFKQKYLRILKRQASRLTSEDTFRDPADIEKWKGVVDNFYSTNERHKRIDSNLPRKRHARSRRKHLVHREASQPDHSWITPMPFYKRYSMFLRKQRLYENGDSGPHATLSEASMTNSEHTDTVSNPKLNPM